MKAILILDHGSRRPKAHEEHVALSQSIQKLFPEGLCLAAHMEIAEPSLLQAAQSAIASGCTTLIVLPWFLSRGRHLSEDVPALIQEIQELYPQIQVQIAPALGDYPQLAQIAVELCQLAK